MKATDADRKRFKAYYEAKKKDPEWLARRTKKDREWKQARARLKKLNKAKTDGIFNTVEEHDKAMGFIT